MHQNYTIEEKVNTGLVLQQMPTRVGSPGPPALTDDFAKASLGTLSETKQTALWHKKAQCPYFSLKVF